VTGEVLALGSTVGGIGDDVAIMDVADGATSGDLTLEQVIYAGTAAQVADANVLNAAGGAARNELTRVKSVNNLTVSTRSTGGRGGSRWVSTGVAGDGGSGEASSHATNLTGVSSSIAFAKGGDAGGGFYGSSRGDGGDAIATATASGIGGTYANAIANGGYGTISGIANSNATASAISGGATASAHTTGSAGSAIAAADTSGGLVVSVQSRAAASVLSSSTTHAGVGVSETLPLIADGQESTAYGVGLPDINSVASKFAGNSDVASNFDLGGSSDMLGYTLLGARYSGDGLGGLQNMSSSVGFSLDMSQLASELDLIVGILDDPFYNLSGFDSLGFKIEQEDNVVLDLLFTDIALATDYFSDNTLNLGDWSTGLSSDGILDLVFSLDVTASSINDSVAFELIFGNSTIGAGASAVPVPASVWLFGSGLLGMLGIAKRKKAI
jgi:hypothetical protein